MKVGANLFHFRGHTRIGGKRWTCTGVKSPLNRKICAERSVEFPVSLFSLRRKFSTKPYPPALSLYVAPNIKMSASPRAFECRSPVESSLFLQWSFVPLRDTDRVWQDIELDCHQCWCQDRFGFYRPLADTAWLSSFVTLVWRAAHNWTLPWSPGTWDILPISFDLYFPCNFPIFQLC